jgi:hypothetical protein
VRCGTGFGASAWVHVALRTASLNARRVAAGWSGVTSANASPPMTFFASAVTGTETEAPEAAKAAETACSARMNESRAPEESKAKNCSGTPDDAWNDTDMTCGLPSRATAAHTQPAMGMAAIPSIDLPPPSALLKAFSPVLPYAMKLLAIVMHTVSHFLNNALAS